MHPQIIDTHIHIWNFDKAKYAWLEGDTSILNRSYDLHELEPARVRAGVTEGILVQAASNFEDTDWMLEVAEQTDWIKGVVGWLPLLDPEAVNHTIVNKYNKNYYVKGVRHMIHNEPDTKWLLQPKVLESLAIIEEFGLPYDVVGIVPSHIETVLELAKTFPKLRMVFDHLNQPPIAKKEKFGRWGKLMLEASQYPNLYCKISGLGTASQNLSGWKNEDVEPYINFVLEHFGTDRCFCGGDWPVSLLAGNYEKTWIAMREILSKSLSGEKQADVLYHNAKSFYKL